MATYYLATAAGGGNDSNDGLAPTDEGGGHGPWLTWEASDSKPVAGDTLLVRGGTYQPTAMVSFNKNGNSGAHITVMPYQGETVIVDGNNYTVSSLSWTLIDLYGDYIDISDIEIRYSGGSGLWLRGDYCTATGIYSHHVMESSILVKGAGCVVDGCISDYASMKNEDDAEGAQSNAISCRNPATDCIIRNCTCSHSWGEGIALGDVTDCTIEDCVSYDCKLNFYIVDSSGCTFQRNLGYVTNDNPLREGLFGEEAEADHLQQCFSVATEDEGYGISTTNNTIINNIMKGGTVNYRFGNIKRSLVAHNTSDTAVDYPTAALFANIWISSVDMDGATFRDNIVIQGDVDDIGTHAGTNMTTDHNAYDVTPTDTTFTGTGDVVGDPKIARTGSTAAGELTGEYFKLQSDSPCINAGVNVQVCEDYFKQYRPIGAPDIGAHEYDGSGHGSLRHRTVK